MLQEAAASSDNSPNCCSSPSKWEERKSTAGFYIPGRSKTSAAPRKGRRYRNSLKWLLFCIG